MGKSKVIDKDRGFQKMVRDYRKMAKDQPYVKVGVIGEKAAATEHGSDLTVADIATIQEFGAESVGIPERSYIRATIDKMNADLAQFIERQATKVIREEQTAEQALDLIGLYTVSLIKAAITAGIPPELAASTIKAKTRAGKTGEVPLVNFGQLINSIQHKVVMGEAV